MTKRLKRLSRFSGLLIMAGDFLMKYQMCILNKSTNVILCRWLSDHREGSRRRFLIKKEFRRF